MSMSQESFASRLPYELLDNIFCLAVTADVSPITLSHVSTHWRDRAVHCNPSLWDRLFISLDNCLSKPGNIDRISAFLERSSPLPLSIVVHVVEWRSETPTIAPQILSILATAASRWQMLEIPGLFFKFVPLPPHLDFPLLEKLLIQPGGFGTREPELAFLRAPNLRYLDADWSLGGSFGIPWSQIKHARIKCQDFLTNYAQMPHLETLHIYRYTLFDSLVWDPRRIAGLSTVLRLTVYAFNYPFLRRFKFNNLISLELLSGFRDSMAHCPTAFISKYVAQGHIGSSLRHLSTHFSPSIPTLFKDLLQLLPCLEMLSLFCIWAEDSTNFPEVSSFLFRDLTVTDATCLVPNLAQLTLRGVPFLDHDFQAFVASRGPSLQVSIIFKNKDTTSVDQFHSYDAYIHQLAIYAWLDIRTHLQQLQNSGQIDIHVEGETALLAKWGPDITYHHKAQARLGTSLWYLSEDIPNCIWGENEWPPNVSIEDNADFGQCLPVVGVRIADLEAARALKERYKHIGSLDQVKLEPF